MPHRAPPADRYGARLYAAQDGSIEIYDPSRRPPAGPRALVLGLTALGALGGAAAAVLALRAVAGAVADDGRAPLHRGYPVSAPYPARRRGADVESLARTVRGALTSAESVLNTLRGVIAQAESAAKGFSSAAGQVRAAVRPDGPGRPG